MTTPAPIPDERSGLPSASGIDRIHHCPGSFAAERGMPELPAKDNTASAGTDIHEAIETDDDSELQLTEKEIAAKLKQMEADALAQWREEFSMGDPTVHREQRLWLRNPQTLQKATSAKLDVFFKSLEETHALVLDFKSGFRTPGSSDANFQLRTQAACLRAEYPTLVHIRVATAHSRLGSTFDATDYALDDLIRAERDIRRVLWQAEQPGAPRVPGDWCRYCRAQGSERCKESLAYTLLPTVGMPLDAKGKPDQMTILRKVQMMPANDLAFVYRRKALLKAVMDTIEHRLKELPAEQLANVGLKVVPGNANAEILDPAAAFNRLPLAQEDKTQCIKILRGKAAELYAEKNKVSKDKASEAVDAALGDVLLEKPGKPRLKAI